MFEQERTHTCGALRDTDMGTHAILFGWVHRIRDLGSLIFVDIRDRHGVTQVVARDNEKLLLLAKQLKPEFVIAIAGILDLFF